MAIQLVEVSRNTRGLNSREIKFMAIGKYTTKTVERETKPVFNEDGSPKLDEKGNQVREPLGKDENGKQITHPEEVQEFVTDGVLTEVADALELVNGDEQLFLDIWAQGYNDWAYSKEASKDELDEMFAEFNLDEDQKNAVKRAARSLAKSLEMELVQAANIIKTQLEAKMAATANA